MRLPSKTSLYGSAQLTANTNLFNLLKKEWSTTGMEWQKIGAYFMDPKNTMKYGGYNIFHFRAGYRYNGFEIWMNVMNATDNYFSYISTKTASGHSYQLAEPRTFNAGISYDFGQLLKR